MLSVQYTAYRTLMRAYKRLIAEVSTDARSGLAGSGESALACSLMPAHLWKAELGKLQRFHRRPRLGARC